VTTCPTCDRDPCPSPSFCAACRDADRRKAAGEQPRYIDPALWRAADVVPGWEAMSLDQLWRELNDPRLPPQPVRRYQPIRRVADDSWLRALVRKVALAPMGERDAILFWAACRCGEAAHAGKVLRDWASEVLVEAAAHAGLPPGEALRTVQSGLRTGGVR